LQVHWGDQEIYKTKDIIKTIFYWYHNAIEKVYSEFTRNVKHDYHKYYFLKFNRDNKPFKEGSMDWGIEMFQWSIAVLRWFSIEKEFQSSFDSLFSELAQNFELFPLNDTIIGNLILILENLNNDKNIRNSILKFPNILKILMKFYISPFFEKYHDSLEIIFKSFLENEVEAFCELLDEELTCLVNVKPLFDPISKLESSLKCVQISKEIEDESASLEESLKLKSIGNEQFKAQKYQKSIEQYKIALSKCPKSQTQERSLILSNISESCLKLNDFENAIYYASKSLILYPFQFKSFFRRARGYEGLNKPNFRYYDLFELDKLTKSKYHEPLKSEFPKLFLQKLHEIYDK
jgi:hypothetical protein